MVNTPINTPINVIEGFNSHLVNGTRPFIREVHIFSDLPTVAEMPEVSAFTDEARAQAVADCADIRITMTVHPDNVTSDETTVTFDLTLIDTLEDGRNCFDTAVSIHNGDWASMRDQQTMINHAIDAYYVLGFDKKFGLTV